jgi:hypothetical protein
MKFAFIGALVLKGFSVSVLMVLMVQYVVDTHVPAPQPETTQSSDHGCVQAQDTPGC